MQESPRQRSNFSATEIEQLTKFITKLANAEAHCVGFVPNTIYEAGLFNGQIHMAYENQEPCGFLFHGPLNHETRIYQTAIIEDCRMLEHARTCWLNIITNALEFNVERISLHCAIDLPANKFWEALGLTRAARREPSTFTRRPAWRWEFLTPQGEQLEAYIAEQTQPKNLFNAAKYLNMEQRLRKHLEKSWRRKHK